MSNILYIFVKGTLMQIWKSPYMITNIEKQQNMLKNSLLFKKSAIFKGE